MRVRARIPEVEIVVMEEPEECPYDECEGKYFKPHQKPCWKSVRDTQIEEVRVNRRKCLSCGRTHRVFPKGVQANQQQTDRMKGVSILFYILGMSYRGVEDMLTALGYYLSHSTVYRNVQAAGKQVRRLKSSKMKQGNQKSRVVGGDLTYVECQGEQATIGVTIDVEQGILLDIELLDNEEADTIEAWLKPVLESVGAEVLLSDDQDAFKQSADAAAVEHQVCRRHVTLNVLEFVAKTADQVLEKPPTIPDYLNMTIDQFLEDLETLEWIMLGHPWNALALLETLFQRYSAAKAPKKHHRASLWYRMRNHVLRLWNHWVRHTCYRKFLRRNDISIDHTNNKTEQIIGWNIKERYRTMRGYKRKASILNVAMLTSWLRENPNLQEMNLLFAC